MKKCVYYSDGVVSRILGSLHPSKPISLLRTQLYYMVCIFFRLALYNLVFIMRDEWYTPIIVGLFSFLSIVHLTPFVVFQRNQHQWWSKKFQLLMSILVLISCATTYYGLVSTLVVPLLLYTSLIGGLVQRWTCCCYEKTT